MRFTAISAAIFCAGAFGQSDYFLRGTAPIFTSDTLYVGAEFARTNPAGTVRVWLKDNEAGWRGSLYLINPSTGAEIYLFKNFGNGMAPTDIDITDYVDDVPLGTPITFRYKVDGNDPDYYYYTGPNLPGISAYVNNASNDSYSEPDKRYGRRFSVVGKSKTAGALDGNLELGFEDNSNMGSTDMDFNDIIFGISGLQTGVMTRTLASKGFVW